jgi:hypothetical protein
MTYTKCSLLANGSRWKVCRLTRSAACHHRTQLCDGQQKLLSWTYICRVRGPSGQHMQMDPVTKIEPKCGHRPPHILMTAKRFRQPWKVSTLKVLVFGTVEAQPNQLRLRHDLMVGTHKQSTADSTI